MFWHFGILSTKVAGAGDVLADRQTATHTNGTLKMRDMKLRDMKMRHHFAGVENARHENARKAIAWNTACCICLSIAEQECMSRQERAPDFAAD